MMFTLSPLKEHKPTQGRLRTGCIFIVCTYIGITNLKVKHRELILQIYDTFLLCLFLVLPLMLSGNQWSTGIFSILRSLVYVRYLELQVGIERTTYVLRETIPTYENAL
jgi:hypothetical protein